MLDGAMMGPSCPAHSHLAGVSVSTSGKAWILLVRMGGTGGGGAGGGDGERA